ncbi:hypothetical protein SAMN05216342_2011 [Exiguobacterium indicum]|nr:hypothetical protein SAMN05216342_2011 [Exiguobacterium enclense]
MTYIIKSNMHETQSLLGIGFHVVLLHITSNTFVHFRGLFFNQLHIPNIFRFTFEFS